MASSLFTIDRYPIHDGQQSQLQTVRTSRLDHPAVRFTLRRCAFRYHRNGWSNSSALWQDVRIWYPCETRLSEIARLALWRNETMQRCTCSLPILWHSWAWSRVLYMIPCHFCCLRTHITLRTAQNWSNVCWRSGGRLFAVPVRELRAPPAPLLASASLIAMSLLAHVYTVR